MHPVTIRIEGYFDHGALSTSQTFIPPRPFLEVGVGRPPSDARVRFLVDTGANTTTICPADALRIWGESYLRPEFFTDSSVERVEGVGRTRLQVARRRATLTFYPSDERAGDVSVEMDVLVLSQDSPEWLNRSLLGRDLLSLFDFNMSQKKRLVELVLDTDDL